MAEELRLRIYVDGSSRGNPGPSGVGVVVFTPGIKEPVAEISKYIGITTNNVAEYEAVIHALKWLRHSGKKRAQLTLDSELIYMQITGKYRIKASHIALLYKRINALLAELDITITLVSRDRNKLANRLAQKASKNVKTRAQTFKQLPL